MVYNPITQASHLALKNPANPRPHQTLNPMPILNPTKP